LYGRRTTPVKQQMPLIAVLFSIDKGDDTSSKCRLLHQLRKMLALQCADLLQFWSKLTT